MCKSNIIIKMKINLSLTYFPFFSYFAYFPDFSLTLHTYNNNIIYNYTSFMRLKCADFRYQQYAFFSNFRRNKKENQGKKISKYNNIRSIIFC